MMLIRKHSCNNLSSELSFVVPQALLALGGCHGGEGGLQGHPEVRALHPAQRGDTMRTWINWNKVKPSPRGTKYCTVVFFKIRAFF